MSDEEATTDTPEPAPAMPTTEADAPALVPPAEAAESHAAEPGAATAVAEPPAHQKRWYVVKVQSGREDSIKGNLERRIKLENLEPYVGRIVVPVEKITEVRDGKRRIKKVKKFPGYLFCEVEFNEHVLYLFRETSG